jgi:signal transduction histidine kinase
VSTELEETPLVTANRAELYDALLNLLINAVDALPEGGRINVWTHQEARGGVVGVSDSGVGMDERTGQRLFEPFFTTKIGVSTGLGLSTTLSRSTSTKAGTRSGWRRVSNS